MDVSIRAVNLLLAYDMLKQLDLDNILDNKFDNIFYKFIKHHGKYIIDNLEYARNYTASNHYLSNLAGLIFVAAYLKSEPITDAWLVFGTQELIDQVKKQFHSEGSNFEGSTSYHRLSTEFVVYSTAIILGILKTDRNSSYGNYDYKLVDRLKPLNQQKYNINRKDFFPQWYIDRIYAAAIFTNNIMNNKNEIVQIGDNDSGRLLKLSPIGEIIPYKEAIKKYANLFQSKEKYYFDENIINHTNLLSTISGIFENKNELTNYGKSLPLENSFIRSLSKETKFKSNFIKQENSKFYKIDENIKYRYSKVTEFKFENMNEELTKKLKFINYEEFGICLLKSNRLYMCIVVDTTKNTKLFGHTHNDKLSIELVVNNKSIVRDPGGYIYTALEDRRDGFRSIKAHNTIIVDNQEQNEFKGIFNMVNKARAYIVEQNDNYIKLYVEYKDVKHIREIMVQNDKIIINDYCNKEFKVNFNKNLYSNGYGKLIREEWLLSENY
jgi:hypothetical protein